MTTAQYISVRETAQLLSVSEKKVMDLVDEEKLQAYKIAGQFLRLKKSEVMNLRSAGSITQETSQLQYTPSEKIKDFLYFNDFYLLSGVVIFSLIAVIFYI